MSFSDWLKASLFLADDDERPRALPRLPRSSPGSPMAVMEERGTYTQLGYRSATINRKNGVGTVSGSGVSHEIFAREPLIAQSRDFYRNNDLYAALVRRIVRYVVGRGFQVHLTIEGDTDNAIAGDTETRWKKWCRRPEVTGQRSMRRVERTLATELLVAGDAIALKTDRMLLQLFEAEQLAGAVMPHDGITRDDVNRPTSFRLCPYDPTGMVRRDKGVERSAESILYVAEPERASSSRPVPYGQASFPTMHRLKDYFDSEVVSAQVQAKVALAITRTTNGLGAGDPDAEFDEEDNDDDATIRKYVTHLPGASIFHGAPGDTVQGIARTAPGSSFKEGVMTFLTFFCAVFGIPVEIALLCFNGLNYSQFKGAVETFMGVVEDFQELLEESFHVPTFEWWLENEIAVNGLDPRARTALVSWIKDKFPWVDRLQESKAAGEQLDRGQTTFAAVCADQNTDWTAVQAQRKREIVESIKLSQQVLTDTGVEIPWEFFCGLKAPTLSVKADALEGTQPGDDPNAPPPGGPPPKPAVPPAGPGDGKKQKSASDALVALQAIADLLAQAGIRPRSDAA